MDTKQVIVIRKDLGMRRGKEIAQGSHASMAFLTRQLDNLQLSEAEIAWLSDSFAKVVCRVTSEEELLNLYEEARLCGLTAHLIQDSGRTEFHGVPTYTCLAIGPDEVEKIDKVTGHLRLY